jgi:hypothetical protein
MMLTDEDLFEKAADADLDDADHGTMEVGEYDCVLCGLNCSVFLSCHCVCLISTAPRSRRASPRLSRTYRA